MRFTRLGNSELEVSRICMGCMGFGDAAKGQHGWTLDEEHSREIIKKGLNSELIFMIPQSPIKAEQANNM